MTTSVVIGDSKKEVKKIKPMMVECDKEHSFFKDIFILSTKGIIMWDKYFNRGLMVDDCGRVLSCCFICGSEKGKPYCFWHHSFASGKKWVGFFQGLLCESAECKRREHSVICAILGKSGYYTITSWSNQWLLVPRSDGSKNTGLVRGLVHDQKDGEWFAHASFFSSSTKHDETKKEMLEEEAENVSTKLVKLADMIEVNPGLEVPKIITLQ